MSRNNERNIKKHNDKLQKAKEKTKKAASLLREKRKRIVRKFKENQTGESQ